MKRLTLPGLFLVIFALALVAGCSDDTIQAPEEDQGQTVLDHEATALAVATEYGWPLDPDVDIPQVDDRRVVPIGNMEREEITDDIAHYSFQLKTGPGEHDWIGIHRVVKERRPYRPIRARKNLFCLHGTPGWFTVMFLPGSIMPGAPIEQSLAVYLAENDIDVWGIDQAYTLLPAEISDFSFMADWGLQFDVDNLRSGMAVARVIRLFTGSGYDKMNLLGFSTGLTTGFAALNMETQLPSWRRQIGGFVPVDHLYKTDDPIWLEASVASFEMAAELIEAGVYHNDSGILFQMMGMLAETDPDGESPIIPGFTNLETALWAGTMTGAVFGFPVNLQFFGGIFDAEGNPVDLNYTPLADYLAWLQGFNCYGSNVWDYDAEMIHSDVMDSPHDDYLHEIAVPVFYVGAGGGFGNIFDYTASLLTGCEVTQRVVQLDPETLLDIGHCDLFTAAVAEQEFWAPALDWIETH